MMKKLLVLMLVLSVAGVASAGLETGEVSWETSSDGSQLIGMGTATGVKVVLNLDNPGLITPAEGLGGPTAGTTAAAGNAAKVQDFVGLYWNLLGEDLAFLPLQQEAGVPWFVFDIVGEGDVTIYNSGFSALGTIHVVPEPISMVLLGIGGLFLRRRK